MKSIVCILSFLLLFSSCTKVYYVDAVTGNDSNSGKSPSKAWASLQKVNQIIFKPGDKILFKSGTTYFGQLEPKGSGIKEKPILIDRYGLGKKPAIHGKGEKLHTVLLNNVEYWEIRNLEITNTGKERAANRRGVIIRAENFGDCHHIILDSLEIHHVNGSLVKKDGGGSAILWENFGEKIPTRFVNLIIQNSYLHHTGRNGINSKGNTSRDKWFPSTGVIIRNNLLEHIPGDGIVPIGCEGAIIENNVLRDFPDILSHEEAAAGIWPWSSDNTLIQYNEVSGHKAKWDGQGFDSDYNCIGTTIQYNYSHDNYGGFLLICNDGFSFKSPRNIGTKNTIIRHNISVNDGIRPYPTQRKGDFSPIFHITGPTENTKIHNNVIILPKKTLDNTIVNMDNWGELWPVNTLFENNIFYSDTTGRFLFGEDVGTQFISNNYYGTIENLPKDLNAIFSKPNFINENARGSGFETLKNFMLKKTDSLLKWNIRTSNKILVNIK
ncbi:right-handed parallel beta-helix repeat-containing protein [Yeosuana sp. AK3]